MNLGKTRDRWLRAADDIREGIRRWELWWLLGFNDIRQRYHRSRIGQLWITLAMAAFVGAIGFVYGPLFKMDVREYLPFLTVNIVVWGFLSGTLNDACVVFTQAESYIRQEGLPKTSFLMRILVRNLLILAHNALLIPFVLLLFSVAPSWNILLTFPGLAIVTINVFLASLFLGVICTRFRDMPQIVANALQIGFFVSPIIWHKSQIPAGYGFVVDFNPLAHHLAIVSEPVLGRVPSVANYAACGVATAFLCALALPFFARYRERIVYWL